MTIETIFLIIVLIILFYWLGRSADSIVDSVRILSKKLGIKIFFLGLILGLFTSTPELAVGLNSIINNVQAISLGNLLGGIIVLFGLVLGLSAVLNRTIATESSLKHILPLLIYVILPIFLGWDGHLGAIDGLILIILYLSLIYYLFAQHRNHDSLNKTASPDHNDSILENIFLAFWGIVFTLLISSVIIRLALIILNDLNLSPFIVGLIIFSLGTNLPELTVTIRSWRSHIKELSLSNLVGSAAANSLLIGFFAFLRPMAVPINVSYYILAMFLVILIITTIYFYKTGRAITKREGIMLLTIYFAFVIVQSILLIN